MIIIVQYTAKWNETSENVNNGTGSLSGLDLSKQAKTVLPKSGVIVPLKRQ
jgi:hypothetical protein